MSLVEIKGSRWRRGLVVFFFALSMILTGAFGARLHELGQDVWKIVYRFLPLVLIITFLEVFHEELHRKL